MIQTAIDHTGSGRGSYTTYATGFILSVILTAIAFGLVMRGGNLPRWTVFTGITGAGILQILAHLSCFLHLNTSSKARWNVLALLFTVLIMVLFIGGSLWIMTNLNYRMM